MAGRHLFLTCPSSAATVFQGRAARHLAGPSRPFQLIRLSSMGNHTGSEPHHHQAIASDAVAGQAASPLRNPAKHPTLRPSIGTSQRRDNIPGSWRQAELLVKCPPTSGRESSSGCSRKASGPGVRRQSVDGRPLAQPSARAWRRDWQKSLNGAFKRALRSAAAAPQAGHRGGISAAWAR